MGKQGPETGAVGLEPSGEPRHDDERPEPVQDDQRSNNDQRGDRKPTAPRRMQEPVHESHDASEKDQPDLQSDLFHCPLRALALATPLVQPGIIH